MRSCLENTNREEEVVAVEEGGREFFHSDW